jgi:hypothetical protein
VYAYVLQDVECAILICNLADQRLSQGLISWILESVDARKSPDWLANTLFTLIQSRLTHNLYTLQNNRRRQTLHQCIEVQSASTTMRRKYFEARNSCNARKIHSKRFTLVAITSAVSLSNAMSCTWCFIVLPGH